MATITTSPVTGLDKGVGMVRLFGWRLVREKGFPVGSYTAAIIDLQERVKVLEHNHRVVVKEDRQEQVEQDEIASILSGGDGQEKQRSWKGGLWEGL